MNKLSINKGVFKIFNWGLLAVFFAAGAFLVVSYAAGYSINFKTRKISSTALIDISCDEEGAQIYLDEKLVGVKNFTLKNLEPRRYDLKITKNGYYDWEKSFDLNPAEAKKFYSIVLFRKEPKVENYDVGLTAALIERIADTQNLTVSGGEIYYSDKLITRFMSDISGPSWYPNAEIIAFTQDNRLKLIETDGANIIDLLDKQSRTPVIFANSGRSVIYESAGQVYRATIR